MRPQDRSPNRRSRGGSRQRSGESRSSHRPAPQPVKQTFWQKLVALFTGQKSPSARVSNGSRSNRNGDRSEQSERRDRFERNDTPAREARKPEVVEVSSPKLYVGNLSFDATENDLFELFNGVGKVLNAEIVSHKYTQKSKGFSFVTMTTVDEAKRAVMELHDKEFMGRKLVVSGSKTSDLRGGGSGAE